MFDNATTTSYSVEDEFRTVAASCFEERSKQSGKESFSPVKDLHCSCKAIEAHSKITMFRKVVAYGKSEKMVGFTLVIS